MPDSPEGRITLALLGEQLAHLVKQTDAIMSSVERLIGSGNQRDQDITAIRTTLQDLPKFETRLEKAECAIHEIKPWISGLKWVVMVAGGLLVTGLVVGVLWAAVQAGGLAP